MSTPGAGEGYQGDDRRSSPAPHTVATTASTFTDAACVVGLTGALCAAAVGLHVALPRATVAVTLLLAGLATGTCFVVAEQAYVRWRLVGDAVAARLCVAFVVYGAVVVPVATTRADGAPGAIAQTVGAVGASWVLLRTLDCPDVDTRSRILRPIAHIIATAAVAAVAAAAAPGLAAHLDRTSVLGEPLIETVPAALLVVTAGGVTAAGVRRRRRTLVRTGLALALLVVAPAVAAAGPTPPSAHLLAAAVQVGALALVVPPSVADSRLALSAVGRANTALRRRWLDAAAEARTLSRVEAERRHQLRSALLALEGASDVLRRHVEGIGRPDDAELAAALSSELARLHHLVAGPTDATTVRYELRAALVPAVVARRACGQHIELDVPPGTTVVGRPTVLAEAVGNLLANAATHAPGSHVVLSSRMLDGQVRLYVRDDGPGLDPAAVGTAPRPGSDGLHGIGLAMAARLVAADGGRLSIAGDQGTTVLIDLPTPHSARLGGEGWTATAS